MELTRRTILRRLALTVGGVVLMPAVACTARRGDAALVPSENEASITRLPLRIPPGWDPVGYNRLRGNAGFIPATYLDDINGPDGSWNHVGKHLPFVVPLDETEIPSGYVALMWGDPAKGHSEHPNARRGEANKYQGHWYNWIRIRKATDSRAEELQSTYGEWPGTVDGDNGAYAVAGSGNIEDDAGKNTVYLAALPKDVRTGDIVRVHAHCLTHGEYVDFVRIP